MLPYTYIQDPNMIWLLQIMKKKKKDQLCVIWIPGTQMESDGKCVLKGQNVTFGSDLINPSI